MGHNLNMSHDFLKVTSITHNYAEKVPRLHPVDDSSCTNINGIMDYYGVSTTHYFEIIILLIGSVKTKICLFFSNIAGSCQHLDKLFSL